MRAAYFWCLALKSKRTSRSAAADLYTSTWFTRARQVVERHQAPWFILSAKHGLLAPEKIIDPYEATLNSKSQCLAWSDKVIQQMESDLPDADEFIVFAGNRYREFLMPYLRGRFPLVKVPMEGMRNGLQIQWLGNVAASNQDISDFCD